jgi:hypothetical protein
VKRTAALLRRLAERLDPPPHPDAFDLAIASGHPCTLPARRGEGYPARGPALRVIPSPTPGPGPGAQVTR